MIKFPVHGNRRSQNVRLHCQMHSVFVFKKRCRRKIRNIGFVFLAIRIRQNRVFKNDRIDADFFKFKALAAFFVFGNSLHGRFRQRRRHRFVKSPIVFAVFRNFQAYFRIFDQDLFKAQFFKKQRPQRDFYAYFRGFCHLRNL